MADKHLYIISGPNGAGKTTASYTVLPKILQCKEFVNADEIARGLSPFNPESVAIEAGRLMLKRISELLQRNESFSIETTLSTRSYFRLVEKAHSQGYWEGMDNLFKIYMPIVDTWILVNNGETPRSIVATGGKDQTTIIKDNKHFKTIEEYVKR
jgi:predicted ABC-type ATPase